MRIADLRSQFTVFVFLEEVSLTSDIKQNFAASGYEAFMFIDQDILMDRVKQAAPHVILFSPEVLISSLSEFTQAVLNANPEIQFVCVVGSHEVEAISEYRDFGYSQAIEPGENLATRALWAVDNVCEKLALTYQNEALLDQMKALQSEEKTKEIQIQEPQPEVSILIQKFQKPTSKEDMIAYFLRWFSERIPVTAIHCVFFKFLPTVMSFVATQGHGVDLERTKGVGAKITADEFKVLMASLLERRIPGSLENLMKDGFRVAQSFSFPLLLKNQVEGVFVFWGTEESQIPSSFFAEFQIFQLCYQNAHYQRRSESLEVTDPVTDLFNKNYFQKRLEEELARARRLTKAVSLVKLQVDNFSGLEKNLGVANRDLVLRSIASLVKKTSRVNDFACRTDDDEISMILPHCSRKGAALRAERLRRAVENHSFAINGVHVTVSLGVSEYPTLSNSADGLDSSSSQALEFISDRGGNKVCLFKPTEDFKPDFEVPVS